MMEQRVTKGAEVEDVVAVFSVLDQLDKFNLSLKELAIKYDTGNIMYNLEKLMQGKVGFFKNHDINQFYQENKGVIDTINKNSDFFIFLSFNYNNDGTMKPKLDYYYRYLLDHSDEKEQIQGFLQRLKELNIHEIMLDEDADFTKGEYCFNKFSDCLIFNSIAYLENMEALPNYENGIIKYRSKGSNYKLLVDCERVLHRNKIIVNNMTFPIECLPASTSYDIICDSILSLAKRTKESKKALQNAVDLDVTLQDLDAQMADTCNTFTRIDEVNSKPELVAALTQIQTGIAALYGIKRDYEAEITIENPSLSQQTIKEETKQYVKRRDSMIDID